MFRRVTARLTLACYGLIAVFGQGLHEWLEHDHDDGAPTAVVVGFDSPSVRISSQVRKPDTTITTNIRARSASIIRWGNCSLRPRQS